MKMRKTEELTNLDLQKPKLKDLEGTKSLQCHPEPLVPLDVLYHLLVIRLLDLFIIACL